MTIKELSKMLGVSPSTISKALNDSYEISEETKAKVQEAARLYNYKPNKLAVNLKSGKTSTIGVVLPSIKNFFLSRVLRGIENVIANTEYNIIISITNESYDKEVNSMQTLSNGLVDAIIVAVSEETQIKQNFSHIKEANNQVPVLMFDRIVDDIDCDKVLIDDYESIYNVVKQLTALDKKKIVLASTISNLSVAKLRIKGYVESVEKTHLPVLIEGSEEEIEAKALHLMKSEEVDAFVAIDEEATLACFRAGKKQQLLDDGTLSLVGYARRRIAEHLTPSLTTIDQHGKRVGSTSADLLLERLKKPGKKSESVVINATVQKRSTTQ